jgi:hypothetical protein
VGVAVLVSALTTPAGAQQTPPWDGNPISRGLGPTYGEAWCEPPTPGSGEARQQGPPLAIVPGEAVGCTLAGFEAEARAAGVPSRMSTSLMGSSVRGGDLHRVVVNALETSQQRRDYQRWQELRSIMLTDPERAQARLAAWGDDVKLPIVVESNIHGNEEEGTDAILQVIRDLVTTPRGANPAVDDLLDHAFLIVHPTINPDGRSAETRFNANGFDLNRDLLVQGQPETQASIADMLRWLPPVGLTMHGYRSPTQAQTMTKPHNPGYETDLLTYWNQRRVDANQADLAAVGMGIARPVNDWCPDAEPPAGPLCEGGFPPGPAVAEGWDDWGPFYTAGHASVWALDIQTIEMCDRGPGCDGRFGSKRAQYVSFYSSARFWLANRNDILRDQVEIYRRGVADEERVPCCQDPLLAARGFTEAEHDWTVEYPEAYVIPFGRGQRSDAEANRLVQWLLDNGVAVHRTRRAFGSYPRNSYVVWMDQAFRGLALTVLGAGQDISDRIERLYAPPGAWSRGLIWGADVVEIPRGDASFDPRTEPVRSTNRLRGGVRGGGRADWYAVTLKGPSEVRAVLDLLRDGVDAAVAEGGSLVFPDDPGTRTALRRAGKAAGFEFERGRGPMPPARGLTGAPRIAVLSGSAAMTDTMWSLQQIFGDDAQFVTAGSLQNDPEDPLRDFDVIYNAGQGFPPADQPLARTRLREFFERGGGYIATSQSANGFAFLGAAGLIDGSLTQGSQPAGGGIAKWTNDGAGGPLTGGYAAEDYLYLPTNVTYFTSVPEGAVVDGRYLASTADLFVAGLWRDRQDAAAGAPVIVHGETTVGSRYLALATNPFSRGDAEREWTLIGQAALWSGAVG